MDLELVALTGSEIHGPTVDTRDDASVDTLACPDALPPSLTAFGIGDERRNFASSATPSSTSLEQLRIDIAGIDATLGGDVLAEIEAIHRAISDPCP